MVHERQIARALSVVQKQGFRPEEAETVLWAAWRPERYEMLRDLAHQRGIKSRRLRDTVRKIRHLTKADPFIGAAIDLGFQ